MMALCLILDVGLVGCLSFHVVLVLIRRFTVHAW